MSCIEVRYWPNDDLLLQVLVIYQMMDHCELHYLNCFVVKGLHCLHLECVHEPCCRLLVCLLVGKHWLARMYLLQVDFAHDSD